MLQCFLLIGLIGYLSLPLYHWCPNKLDSTAPAMLCTDFAMALSYYLLNVLSFLSTAYLSHFVTDRLAC